jgi:predicted Rdx family selenoprotein
VGLAGSLISRWAPLLASVELVASGGGVFKVVCDGQEVFDKKAVGRHAHQGEVESALEPVLGPPLEWR